MGTGNDLELLNALVDVNITFHDGDLLIFLSLDTNGVKRLVSKLFFLVFCLGSLQLKELIDVDKFEYAICICDDKEVVLDMHYLNHENGPYTFFEDVDMCLIFDAWSGPFYFDALGERHITDSGDVLAEPLLELLAFLR